MKFLDAMTTMEQRRVMTVPLFRARAIHLLVHHPLSISLSAFLLLIFPFTAMAQQEPDRARNQSTTSLSYGAEADLNARYVWHGITYSEGPVLQPSLWLSKDGFTATIWGNLAMTDERQARRFNEVDLIFSYRLERKRVTIEPTILFYFDRPRAQLDDPPSGMASVKLSVPVGPLSIYTNQEVDFLSYRGAYFGDVGVALERQIAGRAKLAGDINLGWGSETFNRIFVGIPKRAFNVTGVDVSVTYTLNDRIYLRPHVEFSYVLDHQLRGQLAAPTRANVGVAIGISR
jgi:hypothetical protein